MQVKFKKLNFEAVIPQYSKPGDAGMDLVAVGEARDTQGNYVYHTGLAIEIPEGHVGMLFPRSSNAKKNILLTNSVGIIDSGYRGEITLKYKRYHGQESQKDVYQVGDRIGQLIILPYPIIEPVEAEELSETERGTGGYGSTGR